VSAVKRKAVAAAAAATAAVAATHTAAAAAATAPVRGALDDQSTDPSDEEDASLREFLELDSKAQQARNQEKEKLAVHKAAAKPPSETSSKRNKSRAAKPPSETSSKRAKQNNPRAVTSKRKSKSSPGDDDNDCELRADTKVLGFWPKDNGDGGEWFQGIVQSVDYVERTVDVLYLDGDRDDSVPWDNTRILDHFDESDG